MSATLSAFSLRFLSRLTLTVLAASGLALPANASPLAAIFPVEASSSETRCTATYLKLDERCYLVTNEHCLGPDDALSVRVGPGVSSGYVLTIPLVPESLGPPGDWTEALPVTVQSRSHALDLALLETPAKVAELCPSLQNARVIRPQDFLKETPSPSLATFGYTRTIIPGAQGPGKDPAAHAYEIATTHYTDDLTWGMGSAGAQLALYRNGALPEQTLYEVPLLRTSPGMSGGAVVGATAGLVGLNDRFSPFQYLSYVIPVSAVEAFVTGRVPPDAEILRDAPLGNKLAAAVWLPGRNTQDVAGANFLLPGGANGHATGGGNGHATGGDSGAGPLGTPLTAIDGRFRNANPLEGFREPDEGVPWGQEAGARAETDLLGIDGEQIDGPDDYFLRYVPRAALPKARLILRPRDGLPEPKIRAGVLKRLSGYFLKRGQTFERDQHFFYLQDANVPEGFSLVRAGTLMTDVDFRASQDRGTLELVLWTHGLEVPGLPLSVQMPKEVIHFEVALAPGAEEVILQGRIVGKPGAPVELRCPNRSFLKLICAGPGVEFSISESREGHGKSKGERTLQYRFTRVVDRAYFVPGQGVLGARGVDHYFGELSEETHRSTQGFRRKLP